MYSLNVSSSNDIRSADSNRVTSPRCYSQRGLPDPMLDAQMIAQPHNGSFLL